MGTFSTYMKNALVTAASDEADYVSLHTSNSSANEVSGGSYARKAVTWASPSNGGVTQTNVCSFDIPAGTTVTHIGLWTSATGGNFLGMHDVTDETFGAAGTGTVSGLSLSA